MATIAVTGAPGFLGRYITNRLLEDGYDVRAWKRETSELGGFHEAAADKLTWIDGDLNDETAARKLCEGVDAVIHGALFRTSNTFQGGDIDVVEFAHRNILGSLQLMQVARSMDVSRFIFISTCAVHDVILDDRPLDEAHPLWAKSHYGAHKAAIEKFVHSFGLGFGWDVCALRPTGIYGAARPIECSKWFDVVQKVKRGEAIEGGRGGKEVHAADVAKACRLLLDADGIAGQSYNCYDMYISDEAVARAAKEIIGSDSTITENNKGPKNQIQTGKLKALGMTFGGQELLKQTVAEMAAAG